MRRAILLVGVALFMATSIAVSALPALAAVPRVHDMVIRSVTIDPQTKVATARGAVTCTGVARATVFVDVSQTMGRLHTVTAQGDKDIDCDGRVSFSVRLTNVEGRLGAGDARVRADTFTCTQDAFYDDDFKRTIRVTNAQ